MNPEPTATKPKAGYIKLNPIEPICMILLSLLAYCSISWQYSLNILAIIAFATVIIYWAYGLSEVVNERAKEQEKLDYIKDLGFNGIWLMPITSGYSYHKYDVTDYYNVDANYGTLDDFKTLITNADRKSTRLNSSH